MSGHALRLTDAEWYAMQHAFTDRRFCLQAEGAHTMQERAALDRGMRKVMEASGRG